jgi:hypothetical protein
MVEIKIELIQGLEYITSDGIIKGKIGNLLIFGHTSVWYN